jgi:RHS repeat-associated protein
MGKAMARVRDGAMSGGQRRLAVLPLLACVLLSGSAAAQDVVEYYQLDSVGNVLVVTNAQGTVVEEHDYLPFGEELCGTVPCSAATAGQPRRFTGKERDAETGLDYFGARYYQAKLARFTTVDPVYTWRDNLVDPQRWNRYAYGRNNPHRYVDPDGKVPILAVVAFLWGVYEVGSQVYDAYTVGRTIADPSATAGEKAMAIGGFAIGAIAPGGGYGTAGKAVLSKVDDAADAVRAAKASRLRANKAASDAFEEAVGAELKATHEVAVPQITVRTQGGGKTRLDWVTRDGGGAVGCVKCKASAAARLRPGQKAAHSEIARTGGVVVGEGKPGVPGGTVVPPQSVQVRRPE